MRAARCKVVINAEAIGAEQRQGLLGSRKKVDNKIELRKVAGDRRRDVAK